MAYKNDTSHQIVDGSTLEESNDHEASQDHCVSHCVCISCVIEHMQYTCMMHIGTLTLKPAEKF